MLAALIGSLVLNGLLLALAAVKVRSVGVAHVVDRLRRRPPARPDFGELARGRFVDASDGAVIFLGDSQAAQAPVLDMLGLPVRNRAIGGARTSDLLAWIDQVVAERPGHVVLMIGSNDVWFDRPLAESAAALREVLGRLTCGVTVVSVPPIVGREGAAARLNAAFASVVAECGQRFVDVTETLSALAWTDDTLHLNPAAYRAIAPLLATAATPGRKD